MVERSVHIGEVAGPIPATPTKKYPLRLQADDRSAKRLFFYVTKWGMMIFIK